MALVVGTGTGPSGDAFATNSLSAFYLDNGAAVPGWPKVLNGPIFGSPVIGDVTGDHKNDVVVTACATCNDGRVWAFTGHGGALWNLRPGGSATEILSTPILVDLDGNGVNDVAVGQAGAFHFLRGRDGAALYQRVEVNRVMQNSAAVADFGPGYGWRLIVQSWTPQGNGQPRFGAGHLDSFPLPKAPHVSPAWPQWRLGADHIASPKPPPAPPANAGYWLVANDGGIFTFGNARYYGSTGGMHLNQPINGMARTSSGRGYWLVASDGGIFSFGDARFRGSTGAMHLNRPIVGMAATPTGRGYWLVASDGGMFTFGDAHFYGSTGAMHLNRPITGMARSATGRGYWLVASDGGMFTFGDAHFYGSTGGQPLVAPIITLTPTSSRHGYWLVGTNGDVYAFGDARFFGSTGGIALNRPIVTAAASRRS
jgi:hypothetical protein